MRSISAGIGEQPRHLGVDRCDARDRELGKGLLEGGELRRRRTPAAPRLSLLAGQRGVDADEVVGLGAVRQPGFLGGEGSGSVLAFWIFLAMVSASSVMLMRERSEGSDFDIFLVPSRSDMTRVAGPSMTGSGSGK